MTKKDLIYLQPKLQEQVRELLDACIARGVEMRPYCTVRDPLDQAKLWRQSRTTTTIATQIKKLRDEKAYYLADCLTNVGPQDGRHVTNAIPGLSWHQWGLAVDCFWK